MDVRTKHSCWSCGATFVDVGKRPFACPRCGAQPGVVPEFPKQLLAGVSWSLSDPVISDEAKFKRTLAAKQAQAGVNLEEKDVVVPSCRVVITSMHIPAPILVEQKTPFTALQLLQAAHKALAPKLRKRDHHFFQGFELEEAAPDQPPVYQLSLGS